MQISSAHFLTELTFQLNSEDKFNVIFVSNIRQYFSRNITQLIDTHLPQCRSTDEAKKCRKFEENPPKLTQSKSVTCCDSTGHAQRK